MGGSRTSDARLVYRLRSLAKGGGGFLLYYSGMVADIQSRGSHKQCSAFVSVCLAKYLFHDCQHQIQRNYIIACAERLSGP